MKTAKPSTFSQLQSEVVVSRKKLLSTAVALAVLPVTSLLMPAQSAHAQGVNAIEEVVVTARKREESMQEVPVAVNVLTESAITSQRIEGIKDLGTVVPGLVTSRTASGTGGNIYLRGVGTGAGSPLVDQAVAINIDGVGVSSAQLMNAGMFDLQQIEVLRGPQALFYGKNSPGGVIAVHTNDPSPEFEAQGSVMYENETDQTAVRGVVSGPFSDSVFGRLSLGWSETNEHRFDIQNADEFIGTTQIGFATEENPVQQENLFAMGTLQWEPTDEFAATLKVAHLKDEQDGHSNFSFQRTNCGLSVPQVLFPVAGVDNCAKDLNVQQGGLNPVLVAADPHFPNHTGNGFNNNESDFASLEVTYELGDSLTLTSVSGYFANDDERLSDASFQVAALLGNSRILEHEQWSQEFRLNTSFDGPLNFTFGTFYEEKEIYSSNSIIGPNAVDTSDPTALLTAITTNGLIATPIGRHINEQEGTAYSFFVQADWDISDLLTLSAGARYSYEEKEGGISVDNISPAALDPTGATTNVDPILAADITLVDDKPRWENFSPELTLRYQFDDETMFFASYKTAFKSGGFDGGYKAPQLYVQETVVGAAEDNVYDEETVKGFEVGMKSTLLDGTLRLNVTAYSYDYEDMQLSKLSASTGVPSLRVLNAGEASVEGLEIETLWLTPLEGLTLTTNVAYGDAEYDEYIADCITGQTIAMGCDQNLDATTNQFTGVDMAGESLPNASDLSATFGIDYIAAVGRDWNLGLNLTTSYKSDYNPSSEKLPESWRQDSYWWTNASVSLFSSDDVWEFFVRAVNLGDEVFTTQASTVAGTGDSTATGTDTTGFLADSFQWVEGGRQLTIGLTYRL